MLGVVTTAAMPTGLYPTADMPYWDDSFLGHAPGSRGISEGDETPKGLHAGARTGEAQTYVTQNAPIYPNDMAWARSELAVPGNSMHYVPRRAAGEPWNANALAGGQFADSSNQQQVFGRFGVANPANQTILPSNGYADGTFGANPRVAWHTVKNTGSQSFIRTQRPRDRSASRDGNPRASISSASTRKSPTRIVSSRDRAKSGDRTTHNDVERKYRTNLKDKIAELRAAVPSLQGPMEGESDNGMPHQAAPKVSKVCFKDSEKLQYHSPGPGN